MTASRMAARFNARARPRLTAEHAETVTLSNTTGTATSSLSVRFLRVQPKAASDDGLGLQSYTGQATAVALVADLPASIGPRSTITRNGEAWEIRFVEPVDEWSRRLHLSKPQTEERIPGRLRG